MLGCLLTANFVPAIAAAGYTALALYRWTYRAVSRVTVFMTGTAVVASTTAILTGMEILAVAACVLALVAGIHAFASGALAEEFAKATPPPTPRTAELRRLKAELAAAQQVNAAQQGGGQPNPWGQHSYAGPGGMYSAPAPD